MNSRKSRTASPFSHTMNPTSMRFETRITSNFTAQDSEQTSKASSRHKTSPRNPHAFAFLPSRAFSDTHSIRFPFSFASMKMVALSPPLFRSAIPLASLSPTWFPWIHSQEDSTSVWLKTTTFRRSHRPIWSLIFDLINPAKGFALPLTIFREKKKYSSARSLGIAWNSLPQT